ncbi:PAS domain-containing sensor histidine kinase [Cognatishimia activa]|uniref:PAS domain-containing sensor histidine kinase n=1 Tax=Cognatishimia activa TaxID=1715691 RepID=UPI0022305921|nr:PAS domain-containing sensor histidine kinase [Cognatishimia activa]UZD92200.1 PAS domain-containing sensor histidine kinase [Cognatishimia activa]
MEDSLTQVNKLAEPAHLELDMASVLEAADVGAFELDLETGFSSVSSGWKSMLGFSPDAVIFAQDEWLDRVHPDDLKKVQTADEAMLTGATARSKTTFRMRHEDGHYVWIQSNAGVSERDASGMPRRISGVHIDVSEEMERERAKDEFVAMISHELRTPLTSVLGALKMANSGALGELPGPIGNLLQLAQRNSNRLLHLVNELLDFKSLESGTLSYEMTELDAREVASDATMSMEGYLQDGQKIKLTAPDGEAPLHLEADVNRLQQILANLLSNAAKFSPAESEIELELTQDGDMLQFAVRDHGPGVPEELQGRMFQRFTQAKSGEKRKFKSTGLGLSICKQMTEGMGGQIGYFNNEDGGATFWVRLPSHCA